MKLNEFAGTWHIYEMELWDKDYFDMEVQAFIKIERSKRGEFQFGLVSGAIDGKIADHPPTERDSSLHGTETTNATTLQEAVGSG